MTSNDLEPFYEVELPDDQVNMEEVMFDKKCYIAIRCVHLCTGETQFIYIYQNIGNPITRGQILDRVASEYNNNCNDPHCCLGGLYMSTDVQVEVIFTALF